MRKRIVTIEIDLMDDSSLDDETLAAEIDFRLSVGGISKVFREIEIAALDDKSAYVNRTYTVRVETRGESK